MKLEFKNDKYRKARGGYSRFLDVSCANCGSHLLTYQKDGPGILKRMYLDRIVEPKASVLWQGLDISDVPNLICEKCGSRIGSPYIYDKEKRKAILLIQGSFSKKIRKLNEK